MLKTTATEARGAQKESGREGGRDGENRGRGTQYKEEAGIGMEAAADPPHPAEAAVFTSLTLQYAL